MTTGQSMSDEVLATLVANAGDAVIVADPSGVIRYWNPAAQRMFGHAEQDALGASLDIIIPGKLRERHWDGYRRVMATGKTHYGGRTLAVPALRADGTRISIEFTVALLPDATGEIRGVAAILRDVTDRWEQQRALQRRLHELEQDLETLQANADAPAGEG
jgi:PAS domain S-box-containing protein